QDCRLRLSEWTGSSTLFGHADDRDPVRHIAFANADAGANRDASVALRAALLQLRSGTVVGRELRRTKYWLQPRHQARDVHRRFADTSGHFSGKHSTDRISS